MVTAGCSTSREMTLYVAKQSQRFGTQPAGLVDIDIKSNRDFAVIASAHVIDDFFPGIPRRSERSHHTVVDPIRIIKTHPTMALQMVESELGRGDGDEFVRFTRFVILVRGENKVP